MADLMSLFEDMDRHTEEKTRDVIVRAPFSYPGGKSKSIEKILPHLPYTRRYVEPFGGSAAIMLARYPSILEVYNDRYGGVVSFYRCLRDKNKFQALCDWVELTVHSREEFVTCKETWENTEDDVERAGRWYYMTNYSFGSLGRNFGRAVGDKGGIAGKIRNRLSMFPKIHERLRQVQIENQDWHQCMMDYDHPDTVFYVDPPYMDSDPGIYKNKMGYEDHQRLLATIQSLKGFVAVSGYPNALYDAQEWDDRITWENFVSIQSLASSDGNNKDHLIGKEERGYNTEVLWIKEAS